MLYVLSMTNSAPYATALFTTDTTGECHVPDVFADDLRELTATLDWVRLWNGRRHWVMTGRELRAAADAAERIAATCREFAESSDEMAS